MFAQLPISFSDLEMETRRGVGRKNDAPPKVRLALFSP